jgi:hypothetical protein
MEKESRETSNFKEMTVENLAKQIQREQENKRGGVVIKASEMPSGSRPSTNKERIIFLESEVEVLKKENAEMKQELVEIRQTLQVLLELQLGQQEAQKIQYPNN